MKKLLFMTAMLLLASASAHACDLQLEKALSVNKIHFRITCGEHILDDDYVRLTPKDKSKACIVRINGIEQIDRNLFYVHTHCDIDKTLVIRLEGNDTLEIRNAENY
jgi:hypothetical protein